MSGSFAYRALGFVGMVTVLALTSCASRTVNVVPTSTVSPLPTVTFTPPSGTDCHPPSPILMHSSATGFPEVQGAASGGQLWGLLMPSNGLPLRAHEDIKVVWKMTGNGSFAVTTRGPGGISSPLVFGPEEHGSSNYQRPGDEWGTGFNFPTAGCWQIHFTRSDLAGNVWFQIH